MIDALGIIDVTRSNVFVEKGQKYILDFGDFDVCSVNIMNSDTTVLSPIAYGKAIEAMEADSVMIHYSYYEDGGAVGSAVCTVDVFEAADIEDGDYFITKLHGGDYISFENPLIIDAPIVLSEDISRKNSNNTVWRIAKATDGYYTFMSNANIRYLTACNNTTTQAYEILMKTNPSIPDAKWKILIDHEGLLFITPQSGETNCLVLHAPGRRAGTELILVDYYDTEYNYADSWQHRWSVYEPIVYIDHYYDSSINSNSLFIPVISYITPEVIASYKKLFDVDIEVAQEPTFCSSIIADQCNKASASPCDSNCATSCSGHHKNLVKVISSINNQIPRKNGHMITFWTHRPVGAYCLADEDTRQHTITDALGAVNFYNPQIALMLRFVPIYGEDIENEYAPEAFITLSHELAHTFGMEEVYDNGYVEVEGSDELWDDPTIPNHDATNQMVCVMERLKNNYAADFYNKISNGYISAFCPSCSLSMEIYTDEAKYLANELGRSYCDDNNG